MHYLRADIGARLTRKLRRQQDQRQTQRQESQAQNVPGRGRPRLGGGVCVGVRWTRGRLGVFALEFDHCLHQPRDVIVDEFLAPVRGLFEDGDPKSTVNNIFCKGNLVCAETHALGKMKNGNTYDNLYCWVIEVKDDLIYAIREYMDSAYIQSVV